MTLALHPSGRGLGRLLIARDTAPCTCGDGMLGWRSCLRHAAAMQRARTTALHTFPERYVAAVRRAECGTLTCTRRAVQLVSGIPLCGACGDALTDDIRRGRTA